jgi:hypothetical protein
MGRRHATGLREGVALSELKFTTHLIDYELDGIEWSIKVRASSPEDAMRRIRHAGMFGRYRGELVARIPAAPGACVLVRCITWLANYLPWPR